MNKVHFYLVQSLCFLLFIFLSIALTYNLLELDKNYITSYFCKLSIIFIIFIIFSLFAINIKYGNLLKHKNLALIVFSVSLITKLLFVYFVRTQPESDFKVLYDAAKAFSYGEISSFNGFSGNYFNVWAYQTFFVLFQSLILFVYDSVDLLKIINCFFIAGSTVYVFNLSKLFSSQQIAFSIAIMFALFPEVIFYSSVLTNQHVSIFFILGGVYYFLKKDDLINHLKSALFLAVADLIRPEAIIVLIAIIFYSFLSSFADKQKKDLPKRINKVFALLFVYFMLHVAASQFIKKTEINQFGIENRNPEWKFIVGLDKEHHGAWNTSHGYILNIDSHAQRRDVILKYLSRTYNSPNDIIELFKAKMQFMWASPSPVYFTFNDAPLDRIIRIFGNQYYMNDIINVFLGIDKFFYIAILFLCSIGVLIYILTPEAIFRRLNGIFFIYTICLINFGVYLFIEVQPRYRYFALPFIFISISFLLSFLADNKSRIWGFLKFKNNTDISE